MSYEQPSHLLGSSAKNLKAMQKKINEKNEQFYVKKRGLFRKADQVVKSCNSEVFIIVHNKDSDKIFSFTSDIQFNLEKISELVLRDIRQSAILQKNKKCEGENFEQIRNNIAEIEKVSKQYPKNVLE